MYTELFLYNNYLQCITIQYNTNNITNHIVLSNRYHLDLEYVYPSNELFLYNSYLQCITIQYNTHNIINYIVLTDWYIIWLVSCIPFKFFFCTIVIISLFFSVVILF